MQCNYIVIFFCNSCLVESLKFNVRFHPDTAVGSLAAEILKGVGCQDGTGTQSSSEASLPVHLM